MMKHSTVGSTSRKESFEIIFGLIFDAPFLYKKTSFYFIGLEASRNFHHPIVNYNQKYFI